MNLINALLSVFPRKT